ncbi:hypothetical protein LIER_20503 [Lithospermum erythrorhizon]|uniref:Uncharacterized protein n=1 Tax=Lithospermum erythrorhizon TaxID=34254 RepID=A0AAV3QLP9_LITER
MAKFFWASSDKEKDIHWKNWEALCMDKNEGGLRFKDLYCMNLALLAKQGWMEGSNPSFGWRSLLEGRKVLLKGSQWRVGDGRSIDVWKDPWGVEQMEGCGSYGGGGFALDILAMPLSRVPVRDKLI